jgi:hypothetical protein
MFARLGISRVQVDGSQQNNNSPALQMHLGLLYKGYIKPKLSKLFDKYFSRFNLLAMSDFI